MSVVINTNSAATLAANNLATSSASLQRSLNRLSSGSRIVSPSDDAGGLAVSMKLSSTSRQQGAIQNNIGNVTSFLQTQDGVLSTVGKILNRISELKTFSLDPTKNSSDLANYNDEFVQLQSELTSLGAEKFNGISLFGSSGLNVATSADTTAQTVNVGAASLLGTPAFSPFADTFANFSNWTDISAGATASATGGVLTLDDTAGGGGIGKAQTNSSFSGAMELDFQMKSTGSGIVAVRIGGQSAFTGIVGTDFSSGSWHGVKITVDGAGNYATYLDGSGTAAQSGSFGSAPSGQLSLVYNGSGGTTQFQGAGGNGTAFSVTSTATAGNVASVTSASDLSSLNLSTINSAIQDVATYRADNGASQSRLGFASDVLTTNQANLQAANSRITDVDVAQESTQLARYNVLVQSGTAMLSQANQSSQIALKLLG